MPKTRLFLLLLLVVATAQFGFGISYGAVTAVQVLPDGVDLTSGTAHVQVTALSPDVVRVRYSPLGPFPPDHSFAVVQNTGFKAPQVRVDQLVDVIVLHTGSVDVRVQRNPLRISFLDSAGNVVLQDAARGAEWDGKSFRLYEAMPEGEHYFGLGDKAGPLDHRGMSFVNWNTDQFGWQESTDPLYKTIPFFLALREGRSYGVFLDNTYRSTFDFGKAETGVMSFGAEDGELNYYFINGPTSKQVIQNYTALTGRPPMPPISTLGYQQCRYSYYPQSRVLEVASEFRKRHIPADVIYLDIDYQKMNRPFTVDTAKFPDFPGMIKELGGEGFKVIAITDLHIAYLPGQGYKPYDEGAKNDYFVHNPDGSTFVGKVWPGDSVFPDFTRPEVRKWWGTLYSEFVKMGVRGFWNDMDEPAVFNPSKTMPLDTVHNVDGRKTDHREIHNVVGMENVHATYDGLLALQPDVRPFVLTRAAFAGAQRYAASWTGDNSSTWNHMRMSTINLLNLGLSGYPMVGADIGGFNGSPTPELLTRWMELGAFNPIYRNHGAKGTRDREPWVDGPEHEAIRRRYIETRYKLMPYVYSLAEETSRTGLPMMRPLFMEFPNDPGVVGNENEFMLGEALLVAPKPFEFDQPYAVSLPKGNWYDFWTGQEVQGGRDWTVNPSLGTLPVYVRSGLIVPMQPVIQHTGETPQGPLQLNVYGGPNCHGSIYTDDGNTFAFRKGQFFRQSFTCALSTMGATITIDNAEGSFKPWWKSYALTVYGIASTPSAVKVDGKPVSNYTYDAGGRSLYVETDASNNRKQIEVTY